MLITIATCISGLEVPTCTSHEKLFFLHKYNVFALESMFNHPISSLSAIQIFPPRNGFRDLLLSFDEIFHQVLRTPYREVTGPCGVHGFRPLRQLNLFRIWGQGLWGIELQTSQRGGGSHCTCNIREAYNFMV